MGRCGLLLAAFFAMLFAHVHPARAQDIPARVHSDGAPVRCSAGGQATGSPASLLDPGIAWRCPAAPADFSAPRQLVRIPVPAGGEPHFLVSRSAAFDRIAIAWRGPDGRIGTIERRFDQLDATYLDRRFLVRLPPLPAGTDSVVVAIDHPTNALPLQYLTLSRQEPGTSKADRDALMLSAFLFGLMVMPLFFDAVIYRVMRERFILWHIAFVAGMALQLVMSAGLFLHFADPGLSTIRAITVGGFGLMVSGALMFFATFVEPEAIGTRSRRALAIAAAWIAAASALHALGATATGTLTSTLLYGSGLPVGIVFGHAVFTAWKRGSRMVRYVLVGFAPLIVVIVIRVATYFAPGQITDEANGLFLWGMVIEVGATALGVATRFTAIRDERDRARLEARDLKGLAGRDPLTGLMNRRAVEPRFADLRASGYAVFALIDLDHFKSVNDCHGHAVGDEVLRATAAVLSETPDCVAMRLGGEEFLLLLSGANAEERAERMRAALPGRIAHAVPGLSRPVTASMGLVVAPHAALPRASFNDLYVMADKLLYEAKSDGRNRTVSERVRGFRPPRPDRRRAA